MIYLRLSMQGICLCGPVAGMWPHDDVKSFVELPPVFMSDLGQ